MYPSLISSFSILRLDFEVHRLATSPKVDEALVVLAAGTVARRVDVRAVVRAWDVVARRALERVAVVCFDVVELPQCQTSHVAIFKKPYTTEGRTEQTINEKK